jgi:hypothetical protein
MKKSRRRYKMKLMKIPAIHTKEINMNKQQMAYAPILLLSVSFSAVTNQQAIAFETATINNGGYGFQ